MSHPRHSPRIAFALVALACGLCAAPSARAQHSRPARPARTAHRPLRGLVVMPFTPDHDMMDKMQRKGIVRFGLEMSNKLVEALVDQGYKEVRNAKDLTQVLQQQNLLDKGIIAEDTAVRVGKIMGAKYIVNASFTGFKLDELRAKSPFGIKLPGSLEGNRAEVKVFVTLLDLETGKTEFTTEAVGIKNDRTVKLNTNQAKSVLAGLDYSSDAFFTTQIGEASDLAVKNAARQLVYHLDNIATAVFIPKEDAVIISRGEDDGVKVGDRFEILKIKQTKEGDDVIFEEYVPVGTGQAVSLNSGRAKLKVDWTWTPAERKEKNLLLIAKPAKPGAGSGSIAGATP